MSSEFDAYARGLYKRTPKGPFKSLLREAIAVNKALLEAEAHKAAMLAVPQLRPASPDLVLERHKAIAGLVNKEVLGDLPDETTLKDAFPTQSSPISWEGFFSRHSRSFNQKWNEFWQKLGRGEKIIIAHTFQPLIEVITSETPPYDTNPNWNEDRKIKARYHLETMGDLRAITLQDLVKIFGLVKGTLIFEASKKR